MIRSGALYYVIFISFIIALISGLFLLLVHFFNIDINNKLIQSQVIKNLSSGYNVILNNPDLLNSRNINLKIDDNENYKLNYDCLPWGAYKIIKGSSNCRLFTIQKIALVGYHIQSNEPIALFLADENKYLSISGRSLIRGVCYLPKLGIRRASIEGKIFSGSNLVEGEIKNSTPNLPDFNTDIIENNKNYFEIEISENDSLCEYETIKNKAFVSNSFKNKTQVYVSYNPIYIDQEIIGNIKIYSDTLMYIEKDAKLKNIIVYAPKIIFESGFTGNIQAFARDSILIEKNCNLQFPSFLGILNMETKDSVLLLGKKHIQISEDCTVAGGIFLNSNKAMPKNKPYLLINEDANINGLVYCDGNVELKGTIYGSLYCKSFILKTRAAYYENHLLDINIDFNSLSKYFTSPYILKKNAKNRIIEWVN